MIVWYKSNITGTVSRCHETRLAHLSTAARTSFSFSNTITSRISICKYVFYVTCSRGLKLILCCRLLVDCSRAHRHLCSRRVSCNADHRRMKRFHSSRLVENAVRGPGVIVVLLQTRFICLSLMTSACASWLVASHGHIHERISRRRLAQSGMEHF